MPGQRRFARLRSLHNGLGLSPNIDDRADIPMAPNESNLPVWLYPPSQWENVDQFAYAPLPAIGADVTIISFKVPTGRNGVIQKVGNNFVGAGWVEGSGDIIWRILVDSATPPGANSYANILGSLGSPSNPVGISGFRVFENQLLTFIAHNNAVIVAGQQVGARLIGYLYPREYEDQNIWI